MILLSKVMSILRAPSRIASLKQWEFSMYRAAGDTEIIGAKSATSSTNKLSEFPMKFSCSRAATGFHKHQQEWCVMTGASLLLGIIRHGAFEVICVYIYASLLQPSLSWQCN